MTDVLAPSGPIPGGLQGTYAPGFEEVAAVFADNFARRHEIGSALSVFRGGERVVDIWGGYADRASQAPWKRDTLQLAFSTAKGMLALLAAKLHDEGILDYNAPVADAWPAFAAGGKEKITVRQLLEHQAGLPVLSRQITLADLADLDKVAALIAPTPPAWEPGTEVGYHVWTFGMFVGELFRQLTGKDAATLFNEKIAVPFGVDYHLTLDDEGHARRSTVELPTYLMLAADIPVYLVVSNRREIPFLLKSSLVRSSLSHRAMSVVPELEALAVDTFNSREMERIVLGSAVGYSTARALGRVYGALATGGMLDGKRLLSESTIALFLGEHARGKDKILLQENAFAYGFGRPSGVNTYGKSERSFGFGGAGGSVSFADPDAEIGFSWVMNRLWYRFADPRFMALREAVYDCL